MEGMNARDARPPGKGASIHAATPAMRMENLNGVVAHSYV